MFGFLELHFWTKSPFISSQIKNRISERKVKVDWQTGFLIDDDVGDWNLYDRNEEGKTSISYILRFMLLVIILVDEMFLFGSFNILYTINWCYVCKLFFLWCK